MNHIATQHFNFNRILLLAIGLWPYQKSKFVRLQIFLYFGILISVVVFQLTTFVTTECNPDLIIKVFSSTLFFAIYVIKYNSFWVNAENVRYLLEEYQHICNELKDENEIAIIEHYGSSAKLLTIRLTIFGMSSMFIIAAQPIWIRIPGLLLFINESRTHGAMQIMTEYFVDQEKYFYLIVLHTNATFYIGAIVTLATGTTLMICINHTCGMFKIASYRIEQAIQIDIAQNIDLLNEITICKDIIHAVDIHRKALKYSRFLVSNFEGSFMALTVFGVVCMSLNLYRIVSLGEDGEEFLLRLAYITTIVLYLFLGNYVSQDITDHNNHVFATVYNIKWYIAPLNIQRMILFLLQKGTKPFTLTVGRLFVTSLENFSMLFSASVSYFTVLYSMRQ